MQVHPNRLEVCQLYAREVGSTILMDSMGSAVRRLTRTGEGENYRKGMEDKKHTKTKFNENK